MLIDEIKIYLKAGGGGNGVVRWRHEKGKELAGPGGGNGGKGGDVFVQAIRDIGGLLRYRHVKELSAGRGGDGENFGRHGKNGPDLFLELPVGSVLVNEETRERFELLNENETLKIFTNILKGCSEYKCSEGDYMFNSTTQKWEIKI